MLDLDMNTWGCYELNKHDYIFRFDSYFSFRPQMTPENHATKVSVLYKLASI